MRDDEGPTGLRAAGFYWVRFHNDKAWTIGHYAPVGVYPWEVVASDEIFAEDEFEAIGPRIAPLEEGTS